MISRECVATVSLILFGGKVASYLNELPPLRAAKPLRPPMKAAVALSLLICEIAKDPWSAWVLMWLVLETSDYRLVDQLSYGKSPYLRGNSSTINGHVQKLC